jgi:hypothetical protein
MKLIGKNTITQITAMFAVFAMLMSLSLIGTESLSTVISSPGGEDGLLELAYHLSDQAGEQAVLNKTDDSDYSFFRFANHRFFDLLGHIASGSASGFSRLQSHTPEKSIDNKSTILIKLRI